MQSTAPTTDTWTRSLLGAAALALFSVFVTGFASDAAFAQGGETEEQAADEKFRSKDDKSGTNPVNFQNDVRLYHEYQNFENGGTGNVTTFEARTPFADGKWQARIRVPYRSLDVKAGGFSIDESGLGDINTRFLTVPYLNAENGTAWALGLETWFPTASDDVLGSGKYVLGPQVFFAWFNPFGIPKAGLFPGVQQAFSVAGDDDRDDVNETRFDLFFLKQWPESQTYLLLNPQYIVDWENDKEGGVADAEFGYVFKSGVSIYARPGVGLGPDRPLEWNFESGIKYVF